MLGQLLTSEREGKEAGGRRFRLQGNSEKIWARLTVHP